LLGKKNNLKKLGWLQVNLEKTWNAKVNLSHWAHYPRIGETWKLLVNQVMFSPRNLSSGAHPSFAQNTL
jgi:hypothetical protein